MTTEEMVDAAADALTWDARIAVVRQIPERFGTAIHQDVYSAIARLIYVPNLAPDFAYFHWREEYELEGTERACQHAHRLTDGFTEVSAEALQRTVAEQPTSLRIFRLLLGLTAQEFAAAATMVVERNPEESIPLTTARVRSIEAGGRVTEHAARTCAQVIDLAMRRELFGESPTTEVRLKTDKPDTALGWESVRTYVRHQTDQLHHRPRRYGGSPAHLRELLRDLPYAV